MSASRRRASGGRSPRSKTDEEGQGAELGIPRGAKPETCPVRALEAWLEASACRFGPVFCKVNRWCDVEPAALHPDAVRQILRKRAAQAGLTVSGLERLSLHGLRAGFITEAYRQGARDEEIMEHSRHRDLRIMRGYARRAKLLSDSPVRKLGLYAGDGGAGGQRPAASSGRHGPAP